MLEFLETILFVLKLFNMIKSLWVEAGLIKDRPGLVLRTDGSAVIRTIGRAEITPVSYRISSAGLRS